jgi:predicted DNA-binding antitoxin AbrB/MazE fold protein
MSIQFEAVYENGVFRPLQPVTLPERERVTVTVEVLGGAVEGAEQVSFTLPVDRWQAFCDALDAPPRDIPALRKLLTEPGLFDGDGPAAF